MHRPQRWRPSRGNPRHERVSFVHVTQARRASRVVVAHFFESGQRRRLRWGESRAHANAGAVALASTGYIAAIDESLGGATSARPASRVPHSVSRHCPRRQLESRVPRRRSSHPFGAGLDRSPVAAPGQAVVRRTVP